MKRSCILRASFSSMLLGVGSQIGVPVLALEGASGVPAFALANTFHPGTIDVAEYWVSEKLDGIRAFWDGSQLITRGGHVIRTPEWFVQGWPKVALDGELWLGRKTFAALTRIVRDLHPDDEAWRRVKYYAFDVPQHPGTFDERLQVLKAVVTQASLEQVKLVVQSKIANETELMSRLAQITSEGAEGLMLRRGTSHHFAERSDDLLKLKESLDAEATVIAHVPGKGKYEGMLGALEVRTPEGIVFRVGSGFSDEERRAPPPVGAIVTYRYHGTTENGTPRFASFLRMRD